VRRAAARLITAVLISVFAVLVSNGVAWAHAGGLSSSANEPVVLSTLAKFFGGMMPELNPSHIMQVGMGFFASKTLLSAVELGLFTALSKQPMTGAEIARTLGLNPRAVPDFPDALVALGFLERASEGAGATLYTLFLLSSRHLSRA